MIPLNPIVVKTMILILGGMVVLSPVNVRNNRVKETPIVIKKEQPKPETVTPPKHKKKLPFVAGFKKGRNPLPEGRTATQNYQEAWKLLKKEFGLN